MASPRERLQLSFGAASVILDAELPSVSIGRNPDNDIVVNSLMVSGTHAVIERRRDKFVLKDQSTNGCMVFVADRPPLRVHREEMALFGEGTIVVGGAPTEVDRSIRFQVVGSSS